MPDEFSEAEIIDAARLIQYGDGGEHRPKGWFTVSDIVYLLVDKNYRTVKSAVTYEMVCHVREVVKKHADVVRLMKGRTRYILKEADE